MNRLPLPAGYTIPMANGGTYTIGHLIGEGGFSLIYSADTAGATSAAVIKEFFPAEGAFRDKNGRVCPAVGYEESFQRNLSRFENEGTIGGRVSETSFQTIPFLKISDRYAVMKRESRDMRSLADLAALWKKAPPLPPSGDPADRDPVFPDMVRVRYALRIIESLLSALKAVHDAGYLHLDISSRNVIWAGRDIGTGENCEAFLADFGSAAAMGAGMYLPEFPLSYSPGFAAPEVRERYSRLTPATDLYPVGVLLFYLCVGERALEPTHNRKRQIERECAYLLIPERIRSGLQTILLTATANGPDRYPTADSMLAAVRALRSAIPLHPLNPDNTQAFTLYSLKAMLTGCAGGRCSWANELRDRRKVKTAAFPDSVCSGVSRKEFSSDSDFLRAVLPEELYAFLDARIASQPDRQHTLRSVLSCNYDSSWKPEICRIVQRYKTRRLLEVSRSLLNDENAFRADLQVLFALLGEDGVHLRNCFFNCGSTMRQAPYAGLALLILFALLGPDGLHMLLPRPAEAGKLFHTL